MEKRISAATLWVARGAMVVALSVGMAFFNQMKTDFEESVKGMRSDFKELSKDVKDMTRTLDKLDAETTQLAKDVDRLDRQKADKK